MFHRSALALVAVIALCAPGLAQEEAAQEVQALLLEAQDALIAASKQKAAGQEADALYEKACAAYAKVLSAAPKLEDVSAAAVADVLRIAHYNTCCARAQQGQTDAALDALAKALAAGYDDFSRLESDPDLAPLRETARFVQLLERERQKVLAEAAERAGPNLSEGPLFPYDFSVETLEGEALTLESLRGKLVIVDYWGTWCPPCRKEIPHFLKLKEEFGDELVIVGMTWERGNGGEAVVKKVKRFARDMKMTYPLTMVTKQEDLAKVPAFEGFPTTLFLDRNGVVRARETGYRDFETLHRMLHALDDAPHKDAPKKAPPPDAPEEGADESDGGKERRSF